MLKSLTLRNFRGFSDHTIEFGPEVILIGQNNAGKTTAIEALRVLSVCQSRIVNARFIPAPPWLDGICGGAGFRPSLETIDFDFANVHHGYATERPAVLIARFRNSREVHVYIGHGSDQVFCQLRVGSTKVVHSREGLNPKSFGHVRVMPPVGSLLPHEKVITKERLSRYLDGYLAYRHFRNQLYERPSEYRLFKTLLEETWHGLAVQHFENDHGDSRNEFSLLIREGRFTSEVSWHGHGLQAWMQTIWFLARMPKEATIVLDEPDVYLHADLQRKLIKVIEGLSFRQAIIATHSPEIIGDVPFQNVIVIRKQEKVSKTANNSTAIQSALRGMGSLHSIQLSKVAHRGLLLFVEGDDKAYLTEVAFKLGSKVYDSFSTIAIQELKGKGNWQHALGAAKALAEASGGEIRTVLLLDSDYMLSEQFADYQKKSTASNLILKLWHRKEIESYFVEAAVILRYIKTRNEDADICVEDIQTIIDEAGASLRTDLILSYADVIGKATHPKIEPKTAFKRAEKLVQSLIEGGANLPHLLDGKELIGAVSRIVHERHGVAITPLGLCKEMRQAEIPPEMVAFVTHLATCDTIKPGVFDHIE